MKTLRRIIATTLTFCMLSCVLTFAQGDVLSVNHSLKIESNELIVHGNISNEKGAIPLVMKVTRDGEIIAVDDMISGSAENGIVEFQFNPVPFPNNALSGNYEIYVSADFVKAEKTINYYYIGVDKKLKLLESINLEIENKNPTAVSKAISDYRDVLAINAQEFDAMSADAKTVLGKLIISCGKYEIPQDFDTEAKTEQINSQFRKLYADYIEGLKIALAVDVDSEDVLLTYLDRYAEIEKFYADEIETEYDESEVAKYFDNAVGKKALYSRVSDCAKKAENFKQLKDGMLKSALLVLIEEGRYTEIEEIVETFPEIFSVNTTDFNKLSDKNKVYVYQEMANKTFTDIEEFIEKFDEEIENVSDGYSNGMGGSNSGGSSSGGSLGGSKGSISVDTKLVNTAPIVYGNNFDDLSNCEWARESIEYLHSKNIISGREKGKFDPFANITRGEFVKIIIGALNIAPLEYNDEFNDVYKNDWYAGYIAAAKELNIVNGDGKIFNPNGNITREDMAVILFRALKLSVDEIQTEVFYDSEQISDYAKDAIYAMYKNGIINGVGNGLFAPKGLATRAAAAQMVYKAIK